MWCCGTINATYKFPEDFVQRSRPEFAMFVQEVRRGFEWSS